MRVHLNKPAIRVLGVSESFGPGDRSSVLGGVVMRKDLVVDGFAFGRTTVGGDDATSGVTALYRRFERNDINVVLVSGCIISKYNVLDVDGLSSRVGRPIVCLTYRETSGIRKAIIVRFPRNEAQIKLAAYERLGAREALPLATGHTVYVRLAGLSLREARSLVGAFTLQGSLPEPVRLAGLLARARRHGQKRALVDNRRNRGRTAPKG